MAKSCWIVKQEPESYSWDAFVRDGRTVWTGVRNFQARNNLRAMKLGDACLFYHTGEEKQIVGLAQVARESYPDPTATEGGWVCVDLTPVRKLPHPVPLSTIRADAKLQGILLVRNPRLSVSPITEELFEQLLALAATRSD